MPGTYQLSPAHVTLVDTNTFIHAGLPEAQSFKQFRRAVLAADVTLLVPERVEDEVEQSGHRPSLETALDEGWAAIVEAPSLTQSDATKARDIAQRAIASKSSTKEEHEVEKADPVFAGLAVEYLLEENRGNEVTIITADKIARQAIKTAVASLGYDNQIHAVSLVDIIGDAGGEVKII